MAEPTRDPHAGDGLEGSVHVVTGAGSGIGRAVVEHLCARGAQVVVADIDADGATETVERVRADGGKAVAHTCDVAAAATPAELLSVALDTYGRLDGAVNNAGVTSQGTFVFVDTPDDQWDRLLTVNLTSVFRMMREQLRHMQRQGHGAIVNMTSLTSLVPKQGTTAYAASKTAVVSLTRQGALESVDHGVRVNAIAPGVVDTPIFAATPAERLQVIRAMQPGGRLATPGEIASAAVFLLSDHASFISGQVLSVDMGAALH